MKNILEHMWAVKDLRAKILFILGILVCYRILANIPLPGVDVVALKQLFEGNELLNLLNLFSGGGLSNISLVLLGVGPYITASIIMQLLTTLVPSIDRMYKEEGEQGRQKFNMITRILSVPLAAVQSFSMLSLLRSQNILGDMDPFIIFVVVISAVAGTVLLMWLGELITEKGLGNGVSILIFAGIVSALPTAASRFIANWDPAQLFSYLLFFAIALITIAGVILINEGQRTIPVSYAVRIHKEPILPLCLEQSLAHYVPLTMILWIFNNPHMRNLETIVSGYFCRIVWRPIDDNKDFVAIGLFF